MSESNNAPKSSCPSPIQFMESYLGDEDNIYVVTLSSELSGSYNSALAGIKLLEEKGIKKNVYVFNSRSAASGQVAICLKIYELIESGLSFKDVVVNTETFIDSISTFFVLENLEVLRKNGRLTHLQGILSQTLNIRLIMSATENGTITKLGQALSFNRALEKMVVCIKRK